MKHFTLAFFALIFANVTSAQVTPGSYIISGDLGFGYSQTPLNNSTRVNTSFSISPSVGKFISEKYLIGGGIGFDLYYRKTEQSESEHSTSNTKRMSAQFGITRFIPIMDRLYFTIEGNIIPAYSITNSETHTTYIGNPIFTTSTNSSASATLNITPGLTYFINRKWMVNASVGLISYELDYNIDTDQIGHSFGLSARSNGFQIGVSYVLGKGTNQ